MLDRGKSVQLLTVPAKMEFAGRNESIVTNERSMTTKDSVYSIRYADGGKGRMQI